MAFTDSGERLIGSAAKRQAAVNADRTIASVKRHMGTDWRKTIDSHLTGAFLMSRAAIPLLNEGGAIVNMISTRAFMSEPHTEAYAASKGALFALTHALAISEGPRIRVNAIAPGWISDGEDLRPVDHEQHPVGRVGRAEDIAGAVLYLAEAGFVTGQVLTVDGGMTRKMIYAD